MRELEHGAWRRSERRDVVRRCGRRQVGCLRVRSGMRAGPAETVSPANPNESSDPLRRGPRKACGTRSSRDGFLCRSSTPQRSLAISKRCCTGRRRQETSSQSSCPEPGARTQRSRSPCAPVATRRAVWRRSSWHRPKRRHGGAGSRCESGRQMLPAPSEPQRSARRPRGLRSARTQRHRLRTLATLDSTSANSPSRHERRAEPRSNPGARAARGLAEG